MGKHLRESQIWKFFIEMSLGMQYLHANRILHRDIKTQNILLAEHGRCAKISDFGETDTGPTLRPNTFGTPGHAPPEVYCKIPSSATQTPEECFQLALKIDVWSLGCVAVELITVFFCLAMN